MNAIQQACEVVGSQQRLAAALGLTAGAVSQWINGFRPIPANHCPAIERLTGGIVRCESMRPDVDWQYLRGTSPVGADATPSPVRESTQEAA